MATTNLSVRVDENLKKEVEDLLGDLGLSVSAAVNLYFRQMVRTQSIPFQIKRYNAETEKAFDEMKNGVNVKGPFDSLDELWEDLNAED